MSLERDAEGLAEIINRRSEAFAEPVRTTADELRYFWETTPNFDPDTDAVGVWRGDQLVAFASVEWFDEHNGAWVYRHKVQVHPDWFHHGLGMQLLHWSHRRVEPGPAPTYGPRLPGRVHPH